MSKASAKVARKYVVSGRVQGVGYRYFAERCANQLGVSGYVKNCWNGTVEVYAVGDETSLEEFKRHLAEGPRSARVTGVAESDEPVNARYTRFVIEGGWYSDSLIARLAVMIVNHWRPPLRISPSPLAGEGRGGEGASKIED